MLKAFVYSVSNLRVETKIDRYREDSEDSK